MTDRGLLQLAAKAANEDNAFAATRRAIVRAAAAIGETL